MNTIDALMRRRRLLALGAIGLSGIVAAGLRLPFVWTGISPDEGGYAYLADRWGHGARLYASAWLDRPQGLLVVYRLVLAVAHTTWSIRLAAVLFGVGITLLLGLIGWLLGGPVAGALAAAVFAIVGASPHAEAFTFNGELIAALPATAAVAVALLWARSGRRAWLVLAGLAGAAAILMKQSGFDGLAAAILVVALYGKGRRDRTVSFGLLAAGAAVPLAASVIDGWIVGWHDYWFALVEYRWHVAFGGSTAVHRRWVHASEWIQHVLHDTVGLVSVAAICVVLLLRRPREWVSLGWLVAAFIGVNLGGAYWPHYYVQLLPPLALIAGVGLARVPSRPLTAILAAATAIPIALYFGGLVRDSHAERVRNMPYYSGYEEDRRVAKVIEQNTRPGEPIYVLQSRADLYFLTNRTTRYPYLWSYAVHHIEDAPELQRRLLGGRDRPRIVVSYYNPHHYDHSGRLERDLVVHYCFAGFIEGTGVRLFRKAKPMPEALASLRPDGRPCRESAA